MILSSPQETLSRIVANLYVAPVHRHFLRRFLTPDDIAVVRQECEVPAHIPDRAIFPEPFIIRLADRRGWSQDRAIVEVGRGLEMISDLDYRDLCEEIGEPLTSDLSPTSAIVAEECQQATPGLNASREIRVPEPAHPVRCQPSIPSFDARRILSFRGNQLRFQDRAGGAAPVQILSRFQDAEWQDEILFPITNADSETMHQIVKRLNTRTSEIGLVFSGDFHRYVITWNEVVKD